MTVAHTGRRVAAFDFDGTITQRDTLAGFLAHVGGSRAVARALAAESVGLAKGLRHDVERDAAKERVLGRVLAGRTEEEVTAAGITYARLLPAASGSTSPSGSAGTSASPMSW